MTASMDLRKLADDYFQCAMVASPFTASLFGAPGFEHLVPDLSAEAAAETASRLDEIAANARSLTDSSLSEIDRVTRDVLLHEAQRVVDEVRAPNVAISVSSVLSPTLSAINAMSKASVVDDAYRQRLAALPVMFGQAVQRHRDGAAAGLTPVGTGVRQVVGQLEATLALPLDQDPLLRPPGATEADRELVRNVVRPALRAYVDALRDAVLPIARDDEHSGVCHVPDGAKLYEQALAGHTTLSRTPEQVHALGLELCQQLREEYAELGETVFGTRDVETVVARLRDDLDLRYTTPQQIVTDARGALTRAQQASREWFGHLPVAPCDVEEMDALEAPHQVLGYYHPPGHDRPGRHWINTFQPYTRARYEYEALAFHESVPGHHTQIALSQEMGDDVPAFRRYGYVTAFSEGWALYTERLADEMGLYSGDLARFGMLSFDSWRACRLVVDTGIHAFGWSRQRGIDFMWANSALTRANISNEVDRYIAWPGQACAYMTGRLEIDRLRRESQESLGSRFEIKEFHDTVLGNGGLPLAVLSNVVGRWSANR